MKNIIEWAKNLISALLIIVIVPIVFIAFIKAYIFLIYFCVVNAWAAMLLFIILLAVIAFIIHKLRQ